MNDVFVTAAVRTPIGKFLGGLSSLSAPAIAAVSLKETLRVSGVRPDEIDDVLLGQVIQAGVGQAPARQAALAAGLPNTVSAVTVNKVCGSGLQAVMFAAQAVRAGDAAAILAGGMESMSRAPHLLRGMREGIKTGSPTVDDAMIFDGLWCSFEQCHMGVTADRTATRYSVSRADQDAFAAESQARAARAIASNAFASELTPVSIKAKGGDKVIATDEGPRPETTLNGLQTLRTAFDPAGTVTAGNSSTLADGAASLLVVSAEVAARIDRPETAKIVAATTAGTAPADIFVAPVFAVRKLLEKTGWSRESVDLWEINEAFAVQAVACMRELGLDHQRVNVNGGAIALGHPIGASGARVLVTLLHALVKTGGKRGVATLCLGGGNAVALAVERV